MAGKGNKKQVTLTQALAQLLGKTLLPDLKERAQHPAVGAALMRHWQAEKAASRTADGFLAWEQRTLEQVGAAWILSCVFVRTLEDRDLVARRRLAGPGAGDSEQLFFEIAPSLTARDYLLTVFKEVASLPGAEDLLGPRHNPVWRLAPSAQMARALLDFFRQQDAEGGLVWRFHGTDTRFLGDLYQELSEEVRKRYALLQTPGFVERFILEQTLEPAIAEFGLEQVRVIDPTCGSGHFLLGAFDRLLSHHQETAPAVDVRDHALAALGQVYGVDVNPYAVAIARFRLTLVYLQRTGIAKLAQAPRLPLTLVVADSLLHGAKNTNIHMGELTGQSQSWGLGEIFQLDDPDAAGRLFGQKYHAVVGNPPYITCKDPVLREAYRQRYASASGKYALSAPFTERFFQLAADGGFVGLINANSFMKREFGKTLIEEVLPKVELLRVLDTSGASVSLAGHGTDTVILIGRNRRRVSDRIRTVMSKRGEPGKAEGAEFGPVWETIAAHYDLVGFEDDYISVTDLPQEKLTKHPWSIGGGGAAELKELLESRGEQPLSKIATLGVGGMSNADDLYIGDTESWRRLGLEGEWTKPLVTGESIRDWSEASSLRVFFPYDEALNLVSSLHGAALAVLWPYRTSLWSRAVFSGGTYRTAGRPWYEWHQLTTDRYRSRLSIAFAEVATHNHFVLDRGGNVFNQTAPLIKLSDSANEDEHLALLAYLNSSTACMWMRQQCPPKGGSGVGRGIQDEAWEQRKQFNSTNVGFLPLVSFPGASRMGRAMADLATQHAAQRPAFVIERFVPHNDRSLREALASARKIADDTLARMVALQEELDWQVYEAFGLLTDDEKDLNECAREDTLPGLLLRLDPAASDDCRLFPGHRPFEVVLARECLASGAETAWFERNKYLLPSKIEGQYSPAYNRLIETRIAIIDRNSQIRLLEKPEYKRRWTLPDYSEETRIAVRAWILNAAEESLAKATRPVRVRALGEELLMADPKTREVILCLYADEDAFLEALSTLVAEESVPYIKTLRYTEAGLRTRRAWEETWALQRREDSGEAVGDIQVPPQFERADFLDSAVVWRLRGKLDVPNESFISYPGCEKDGEASPLIGWGGWSQLQRAQAIVSVYQERKIDDGWLSDRLVPMLAGLQELTFALELRHSGPEAGSQNPAREFKQFVDAELNAHGLTVSDLEAWRPSSRRSPSKRTRAPKDSSNGNREIKSATPKRTRSRKTDAASETP